MNVFHPIGFKQRFEFSRTQNYQSLARKKPKHLFNAHAQIIRKVFINLVLIMTFHYFWHFVPLPARTAFKLSIKSLERIPHFSNFIPFITVSDK